MLGRTNLLLRGVVRGIQSQGLKSRTIPRFFSSSVKETFDRLGVPYQEELLEDYAGIIEQLKAAQVAYKQDPKGEAKAEYIQLLTVLGYEVEAHKVLAESRFVYGLGPYNPLYFTRSLGYFFVSRSRKGSFSALEIFFWLVLLFSVNWETFMNMFGVEKLSLSLLGGVIDVEPVPKKENGVQFKDIIVAIE